MPQARAAATRQQRWQRKLHARSCVHRLLACWVEAAQLAATQVDKRLESAAHAGRGHSRPADQHRPCSCCTLPAAAARCTRKCSACKRSALLLVRRCLLLLLRRRLLRRGWLQQADLLDDHSLLLLELLVICRAGGRQEGLRGALAGRQAGRPAGWKTRRQCCKEKKEEGAAPQFPRDYFAAHPRLRAFMHPSQPAPPRTAAPRCPSRAASCGPPCSCRRVPRVPHPCRCGSHPGT